MDFTPQALVSALIHQGGMKQPEIARATGISQVNISRIYTGATLDTNSRNFIALLRAAINGGLCTVDDFLIAAGIDRRRRVGRRKDDTPNS